VLRGQCIEHYGSGEALLPLLDPLSRAGDSRQVKAALRAYAPTWLLQLPGLLTAEERLDLQQEVLGATRERLVREGCELLEVLSMNAPLIVVLEDLHWSDYATLDLLAALGRQREQARLLVIGSYRPSDAALRGHPMERMQQELQTHRLCATLPLDAFSPGEVNAYLTCRFLESRFPEAVAQIIYRRTGGHPLFVANLLDYLLTEGRLRHIGGLWSISGGGEGLERGMPEDIRQMIEHQIGRLSPEEQQILQVASAAGMESSAALLAAVLEKDLIAVESHCEALARRGPMLASAGVAEWQDGTVAGNYGFRHALYAEVLYQQLPPAYKVALHRRLGERLELAYGEQSGEIAAELGRHFEEGRDFARALRYLSQAADQSAARFANREALDYLGRALAWVDRLPAEERVDARLALLQQRALVHRALNDWPSVVEDLDGLASLARAEGRLEQEVGGLIFLCFTLMLYDSARFLITMEQAVERSKAVADESLKAYAEAQRVYFHLEMGVWPGDREQTALVRAIDAARQSGNWPTLALYLMLYTAFELYRSDYRTALAAAREYSQLGRELGDGFHCAAGDVSKTWALLHLGEWGELRKLLAEGLRAAEQNASPFVQTLLQLLAAWQHLESLDFQGGLALCERAQPRLGDPHAVIFRPILLGRAHLGLGQYDEAARCFAEITSTMEAGVLIYRRFGLMLHQIVGEYWLAQEETARARAEADKLFELAGPPGERAYLALGHRLLTEIAMAEHAWEEALAHLSRALAIVDAEGAELPLAAWRVYALAGDVNQRLDRHEDARRYWTQSAAIIHKLADSLGEDDEEALTLRASLLNAEPMKRRLRHAP
jgi:tetratricopeptide (TPR) repeat protein